MQRFFTVLTLICLMVTLFVSDVTHANTDESGNVEVAKENEVTDKDRANTAFDAVRNANILYLLAKTEYEKNEAKIERGVAVTASKLLAATAAVYMGGILSPPVVVSTLVDMVGLAESIDKSTPLLSAYEATIYKKQGAISSFESAKTTYNTTYDTYIGVLATHTGWTKSEVYMYISNDANRRNGIIHKGSSGSNKHGVRGQKEWDAYDNTLPSYTCKGSCSDTFITPTLAKTSDSQKCGTADSLEELIFESARSLSAYPMNSASFRLILLNRSVAEGCGYVWYTCDSDYAERVKNHKVRECNMLEYYREYFGADLSQIKCNRKFRKCMGHKFKHDPTQIFSSLHSDEAASNEETSSGLTTTPTPSYHTCGVHASSVSGSHNAAGCGTTGHYVCDGSSHVDADCGTSGHYVCDGSEHSLQASCTSTNSNGDSCTVTSFYACQSHTHAYPAPTITCARSGCGEVVSTQYAHWVSCSNCPNSYWSCKASAVTHHTTFYTCRRNGCGVSFTKCNNGACTSDWGNFSGHWRQ